MQAAVLRGNHSDREILLSLQVLKKWDLVHSSFLAETVSSFISNYNKCMKKYSALYCQNTDIFMKDTLVTELESPSKGCASLCEKLIQKYANNFKEVLGPKDRMLVDPVRLVIDETKDIRPVCHVKPYDTPFHLRKAFEKEINDAIEGEIIVPCPNPTTWASKAFAVPKSYPSKVCLVADFRVLNLCLKKPV